VEAVGREFAGWNVIPQVAGLGASGYQVSDEFV
jgi:hypothetical protein